MDSHTCRFRKAIVVTLAVVALAGSIAAYAYTYRLIQTSPTSPNPSRGQIHAINNHGTFVFVTAQQKKVSQFAFPAFVALGFIAGFLNIRWDIFPSTSRYPEHRNLGK